MRFSREVAVESLVAPDSPAPPTQLVATNQLNQKLDIEALDGSHLILAPLETEREVDVEDVDSFALDQWVDKISLYPKPRSERKNTLFVIALVIGFWFSIAWGIVGAFAGAPQWWITGWVVLGVVVLVAGGVDLARSRRPGGRMFLTAFVDWVHNSGGQALYLLLGLLIGFVLPATAIFFAANSLDLIDHWDEHTVQLTFIGRLMQVLFVVIASLLPVLLFFSYDREHLKTMRTRFRRQILRFDPTVTSLHDVDVKYGNSMSEAYGRDVGGKILPGRRSPLLLATLLIALGWTFTLLHGDATIVDERGITNLFEPRRSAVVYAFLGAYFYGLNVVLRGYVRKDLRAKSYSTLTVRIIVVVVLAWILELQWGGSTLYVLAFLTGIFPDTALVLIKGTLRTALRAPGSWLGVAGEETDPLTNLEGIDIYDVARLGDEGVTNIQGLANHDVVELMLQTRIPIARILDWVDQALLYLHAGTVSKNGSESRAETLNTLRQYGIRTASDLANAIDSPESCARLKEVLNEGSAGFVRIQLINDALRDEEWLKNIQYWRKQENVMPPPLNLSVASLPHPRIKPA